MRVSPRAIDLFCGLSRQPKLSGGAYAAVEQFVACRAENPNHVPLHICDDAPSAVALVLRFVRYLNNTRLAEKPPAPPSPKSRSRCRNGSREAM